MMFLCAFSAMIFSWFGCRATVDPPPDTVEIDPIISLTGPPGLPYTFDVPEVQQGLLSVHWSMFAAPSDSRLWEQELQDEWGQVTIVPDRPGAYMIMAELCDVRGVCTEEFTSAVAMREYSGVAMDIVASAGTDPWFAEGDRVELDGSASTGTGFGSLKYWWSLKEVPAESALTSADIVDRDQALAYFYPDVPGRYIAALVVMSPDRTFWDNDKVYLRVGDGAVPPRASLSGHTRGLVLSAADFDGSGSTQRDGEALSYLWALRSKPLNSAASNASFSSRTASTTTLTTDVPGDFRVELIVFCNGDHDGTEEIYRALDTSGGNNKRLLP